MENKVFLEEKVYGKKKINQFLFYFITIGEVAALAVFYYFFDRTFKYSQIVGQALILAVGVTVLGQMYGKREKYIRKFGKGVAYRKAFYRFHVTTMPCIYTSALHPIFAYSESGSIINIYVRAIIAAYFVVSAVLLHRKTIKIFGVDNLFMYYVYFPEESVKTESIIHSIIRHPVYSAMSRISIGLGILRGTPVSIILGFILPISQIFWFNIFEEKELVERFGKSYIDYKKNVWAIWVKLQSLPKFWSFLIGVSK
ncbi:methyltransferase family protein [Ruminiclostridium josui]|uniref:methyltransferase family protein n=1 Tax=Ruminiclostridium josui TaxID=1499 RepID=UPI000464CF75|nr:methyltransferase [Ruminiclostridium josui]